MLLEHVRCAGALRQLAASAHAQRSAKRLWRPANLENRPPSQVCTVASGGKLLLGANPLHRLDDDSKDHLERQQGAVVMDDDVDPGLRAHLLLHPPPSRINAAGSQSALARSEHLR